MTDIVVIKKTYEDAKSSLDRYLKMGTYKVADPIKKTDEGYRFSVRYIGEVRRQSKQKGYDRKIYSPKGLR